MTTLPLIMATIAKSLTVSLSNTSPLADFNQDGNVDSSDLVALTSKLNTSCDQECPTDLNQDGITDVADLMILMEQWGPVSDIAPQEEEQDQPAPTRDADRDMSWQGQAPILFDAVYYDQYTELFSHGGYNRWHSAQEYNQGEHTMAWASENDVPVQPMVYGSVDWDHDGEMSEQDKENFVIWLDATIPADYDGPLCLDLEGQWWSMLDTSSQTVMDLVINTYLEQLEYAQSLRPNAKIGFWGLPKKSHTNPSFQTASIDRLLDACTAIFPDVYEHNPGGNDASRLQLHVERAISMINGEVPVYAQTFPRYKEDGGNRNFFHTQDEFLRDQVQPALDAVWTDASGTEHRVNGVSFWDAYSYVAMYTDGWSEMAMEDRKAVWDEVDYLHVDFLQGMKVLVDAAVEATHQRIASAKESDSQQAVDIAVTTMQNEQKVQQSRLVRQVATTQATYKAVTSSFHSSARSYQSARSAWSQAKRAFTTAKRKYRKGSSQYKRAQSEFRQARREMQAVAKDYQEEREEYKNARALMNQAKDEWKTANADWEIMAEAEETLLASN